MPGPSQIADTDRFSRSPHDPADRDAIRLDPRYEYLLLDAPRPPVRSALEPLWGLLLAHHARPNLRILLAAREPGLGRLRGLAEAVERGELVTPIETIDPHVIAACRLVIAPPPPRPETRAAATPAGCPVIECFDRSSGAPWSPRKLARTVLEYFENPSRAAKI